ncbi:MAG: DUF3135 domain-containing protein [Gammaproteobacteria bacterium]
MKTSQALEKLDFDHWLELAKADPDSFETMRRQIIDAAIGRFAESRQLHLRRVQWRIDQVRKRSRTPMAACIAISNMMWDSFHHLNTTYRHLYEQTAPRRPVKATAPLPSATVLAFRPPAH